MTINEKIIAVRTELNLSQEGFAKLVGVTRQAVSRWEKDEASPDVKRLQLICEAAGCTLDEFVSDDFTYGEEGRRRLEERKIQAELAEQKRRDELRRVTDIKCAGLVLIKLSVLFFAVTIVAAMVVFFARFAIAEAFGLKITSDGEGASALPVLFAVLISCAACAFFPVLYNGLKRGKHKPKITALAACVIAVFSGLYGLIFASANSSAATDYAVIKALSYVNILFAAAVCLFLSSCVLCFADSVERATYAPTPSEADEKYIFFSYIAGAVLGFFGTPLGWAAGFIIRSEIIKTLPQSTGKYTQALVGGAIGEVVAVIIFFIIRYIVQSF